MDAFTDGGGSSGFDHFDGFPGSSELMIDSGVY